MGKVDSHATFDGSIPENYDTFLGPLLLEPYAVALMDRVPIPPGARVLETACGTGRLTRHLLARLPADGSLVATDLNEPMLSFARSRIGEDRRLEWRQAEMAALPFPDASFDVVVSGFGVMFVPDKAAAFREAARVLTRDGVFAFSVWDAMERNALAHIGHDTISRFFANDPPTFYLTPFGFHDEAVIRALVEGAGFDHAVLEWVDLESVGASARDVAAGLVLGNPVVSAIRERGLSDARVVVDAVADNVARVYGDAPVRAPMRALLATARTR